MFSLDNRFDCIGGCMRDSKTSPEMERYIRLSRLQRLASQSKVPSSLVGIYAELLGEKGATSSADSALARLENSLDLQKISWKEAAHVFYSLLKNPTRNLLRKKLFAA